MDFKNEFQRISNIIDNMSIKEFEEMLFECGLGTICPSGESIFVKCLNKNFFEISKNYVSKDRVFLKGNYQDFNDFNLDGQEVA